MSNDKAPESLPYSGVAGFEIPEDAISVWTSIPEDKFVSISLTRDDLDRFYFAQMHLVAAIDRLQSCVIQTSREEFEEARKLMGESVSYLSDFNGNMRAFMTAIMRGASKA